MREMAKAKLSPELCYMAGLMDKGAGEKSEVCITTNFEEVEQRFLEIAVKNLGIKPNRIVIEEKDGGLRRVLFYHSRIAKALRGISENSNRIFIRRNELSAAYVAGLFDAMGHANRNGVYMRRMDPRTALLLEQLGIHTRENRIAGVGSFMELVKGQSMLASRILGTPAL